MEYQKLPDGSFKLNDDIFIKKDKELLEKIVKRLKKLLLELHLEPTFDGDISEILTYEKNIIIDYCVFTINYIIDSNIDIRYDNNLSCIREKIYRHGVKYIYKLLEKENHNLIIGFINCHSLDNFWKNKCKIWLENRLVNGVLGVSIDFRKIDGNKILNKWKYYKTINENSELFD